MSLDEGGPPAPAAAPASPGPSWWARVLPGTGLAITLVIAIWPRLHSLPVLFRRGEPLQWDGDSAYHLKRMLHAVARFPELPRFDPSVNWPAGGYCHWPDGFDLLGAAWGLLAGMGSAERSAMAVLLFSVVVALFAVWAAMDLARLILPHDETTEGAVAAAGLLTAVLPSSVFHSQVGYLDHHIAELLSFLLLAGWALRRVPRPDAVPAVPWIAWEAAGAAGVTFALWVYSGGILYVAIAAAILLVANLRDPQPRWIASGALALCAGSVAVALLTLPSLRAHGRLFSYTFPSLLQPLLTAMAGASLAMAVLVSRYARRPLRRTALLGALGLLAVGLVALAVPAALRETRDGLMGWLFRRDPWIASIAEFQPFGWNSPVFLVALFRAFGAIGVAAPLVLVAGAWASIRSAGARGVAFVALSAGLVLFTLNQVRFERIGLPLLMINAVAGLTLLIRGAGVRAHPLARKVFVPVATLVLIATDYPLRHSLTDPEVTVPPQVSAALALREEARRGAVEGVLAAWDHGHFVNFHAGLPVITNGFGSYLDAASFAEANEVFTSDGATLDRFLEGRRVRFVLAGPLTERLQTVHGRRFFSSPAPDKPGVLNLDYMKSFGLAPLVIGGSAIPGAGVHHLERLMPIFATREFLVGMAFPLPTLWLYERVPGAVLTGTAPPGSRVVATLDFREQGRPHVWRAFADTNGLGTFTLRIPFPSGLVRPAFSSDPRFALSVGDGPVVRVEVPERSVRQGATIPIGRLPPPGRAAGQTGGTAGSRSLKTAPATEPFSTDSSPPKDSAIP